MEILLLYFTPGTTENLVAACFAALALAGGALSPLVVSNRMAYFSDAVAHSTLTGVSLGLLIGISPVFAMLGTSVLTALVVSRLRRRSGQSLDTILGVVLAGMLSLGVILYSFQRSYTDLHGYLFGSVTFVTWVDALALGITALLCVALVVWRANRFALISVSRPLALSRGVNVDVSDDLLILMLGVFVGVCVQAVGLLLVNAMLVVPAATSRNLARSWRGMAWGSLLVALAACAGGLVIVEFQQVPPGPAVVGVAVLLFIVSQLLGRGRRQPLEA